MRLPNPKPLYTRSAELERNRQIESANALNHKRGQDIEGSRIILASPDGTRWLLSVDNAGALTTTSL